MGPLAPEQRLVEQLETGSWLAALLQLKTKSDMGPDLKTPPRMREGASASGKENRLGGAVTEGI